jgi:hypothetical protein
LKNNFKLNEKTEIKNLNNMINSLKNELEINQQKIEFNNNKYSNLQNKYLKLFQQKRKIENESLLKMTKENANTSRLSNVFFTPKRSVKIKANILNTNTNTNSNTITTSNISNTKSIKSSNDMEINLPFINEMNTNSSLTINRNENLNRKYFKKKKQNTNIIESYSMTNNES